MIQQDTIIQPLNDTLAVLPADTLTRADSLAIADSLTRADSLRVLDSLAMVRANSGFVGSPLPSLPQTEPWVFAALVVLFLLLAFSLSHSRGMISDTIQNFFQVKERSSIFSKATINDFRFRFFLILFSIGVISLFAYLVLYRPPEPFSVRKYGYFLLATLAFFALKSLAFNVLGYVFLDAATLKKGKETYFNIIAFLGVMLFPLMIFYIYAPYNYLDISILIGFVMLAVTFLLIAIKLFQIFFHKLVASLYILLYLCTLEILPFAALFRVYQIIV